MRDLQVRVRREVHVPNLHGNRQEKNRMCRMRRGVTIFQKRSLDTSFWLLYLESTLQGEW